MYTKLKTSKEILEHMSKQETYNEKDIKRIDKIFTCLNEILIQKESSISNVMDAFNYMLENTKIKREIYPDWIEKPKTKEKFKLNL